MLEQIQDIPKDAATVTVQIEYGGNTLAVQVAIYDMKVVDRDDGSADISFEIAMMNDMVDVENKELIMLNDFDEESQKEIHEKVVDATYKFMEQVVKNLEETVKALEEEKDN